MAMGKGFRVLEKISPGNPYSILLEQRNRNETLLFENQAVAVLSIQETDSMRKPYTKLVDAYGCLGVLQLNAGESTVLYLVLVTGCVSVGKLLDSEIFRITQTQFISLRNQQQDEERISEVRRLLNSGTFYFSWSQSSEPLDLTLCAQRRKLSAPTDNRFFWNRILFIHLMRFGVDCSKWVLKAVCGSVEIRTVYVGHRQARACIISRLSCERAGTRFNVRGTNDDGHVANFVETEQMIVMDDEVTSYIQIRGSVPLFWEQPGVQVGSHKIKMSRSFDASQPVFNRHMEMLKARYRHFSVINLLGSAVSKDGEGFLSQLFQAHHKASTFNDVPHILFDYHQECRGSNKNLTKLKEKIFKYLKAFSLFHNKNEKEQQGVMRTNCLDCLDRTNCVQTFIGLETLNFQLYCMGLLEKQQMVSRFEEVFRQLWINNGNEISKIYAGTGAIQGSSKIMDGARSAARTIQNNLLDNSKQEAIDILLLGSTLNTELSDRSRILLPGYMQHAPNGVLREMCKNYGQFVYGTTIRISVGTYNVNGGKHFRSVAHKDLSLTDWLLMDVDGKPVDIFAIGFEEIVDLSAGNIVAASSENAKLWAEELEKVLSRDYKYVLITYMQLVGVCLYLFVRYDHIPYVRDLALDSVKTGLGGATGNKGACAIRFLFYNTSLCFVCAHFAAGQSQVNERNADYSEITRKIVMPMGRTLTSHDYVFWCGDFNYRIDMEKDVLKDAIKKGELDRVLNYDQLLAQQKLGNVFKNFIEGDIKFPPTYKYDIFSDDYDTSEKQRAPAWTDRVLWRRRRQLGNDNTLDWNQGQLIFYGRAELKQSDHRPVIAIVDVEIFQTQTNLLTNVFKQVTEERGPPDATIVIHVLNDDPNNVFDEDFMMQLLQELSQIGEVILVRFVDDTMWITFRDGQAALAASKKKSIQLLNHTLQISLKTENWVDIAESEIALCSDNTIPLTNTSVELTISPSDVPPDEVLDLIKTPQVDMGRWSPLPEDVEEKPKRPPPMKPQNKPRAGVISMPVRPAPPQRPPEPEPDPEPEPVETAIYEEIPEVEESKPVPVGLPPPPPLPQRPRPAVPERAAPPVPARSGVPPPIPARTLGPPNA